MESEEYGGEERKLWEKIKGRESGEKGEREKKDDQEKQHRCKTASKPRGGGGFGGEKRQRAWPNYSCLTHRLLKSRTTWQASLHHVMFRPLP